MRLEASDNSPRYLFSVLQLCIRNSIHIALSHSLCFLMVGIMDWRAALALVKTQQQLLNAVLREVPASSAPHSLYARRRIVSPAMDAFPELQSRPPSEAPRIQCNGDAVVPPEATDDSGTRVVDVPGSPEGRQDASDDDTVTEGSSTVQLEDAMRTPRSPEDATSIESERGEQMSPLVTALLATAAPAAPTAIVAQPDPVVVFASAESFVDAVLGDVDGSELEDAPPVTQAAAVWPRVPRSEAIERSERNGIEAAEDEAAAILCSAFIRRWAMLECRCAAEFSLLDSIASEVATLEAYRRRFLATCSAEFQGELLKIGGK